MIKGRVISAETFSLVKINIWMPSAIQREERRGREGDRQNK